MVHSRSQVQNINIVSNNYSRYGTSIYQQLYDSSPQKSKYSKNGNGSNGYSYANYNDSHSYMSNNNNETASISSSFKIQRKRSTNKLSKISSYETNTDNESIMTNGSKASKIKRKYKSLITSSSKKLINKLYDHGSSDSFSIFSSKSHKDQNTMGNLSQQQQTNVITTTFQPIFPEKFADINDLPLEILTRIVSYIDQEKYYKCLVICLYVSKKWYKATKFVIYSQPKFVSTYRVAQFVTSLRLNPDNGKLVKFLNLSNLKNGLIMEDEMFQQSNYNKRLSLSTSESFDNLNRSTNREDGTLNPDDSITSQENTSTSNSEPLKDIAYAGWRDWRYRNDPLYSSPILNSYTVKRIVSRSSSIHSSSSNFTTLTNGSGTSINTSSSTNTPSSNVNGPSSSSSLFPSSLNGNGINQSVSSSNQTAFNKRVRSNSSVSSITSSIMSSFQNTSHLSLTSSNYNLSTPSPLSNKINNSSPLMNSSTNLTGKFNPLNELNPITSGMTNHAKYNSKKQQTKSYIHDQDDTKWFRFNIAYKNKRRSRNLKKYSNQLSENYQSNNNSMNKIFDNNNNNNSTSNFASTSSNNNIQNDSEMTGSSNQIRFAIEQPFKTNHPYTNKFLLKYAPYRDLPLGYILHILNKCPNLTQLDLSNLIICNDFKVIRKSKHHKRLTSLILPSVEETSIMTNSEENRLDVIYATDSSKNYESAKDTIIINSNENKTRPLSMISCSTTNSNTSITGLNPNYWLASSNSRSDYPLPIDSQTKMRELEKNRRHNHNKSNEKVELQKLNPVEIFEFLTNNESNLSNIKLDGAVWCRQYMVKYFILTTFNNILNISTESINLDIAKTLNNQIMDLSFLKAGMNRNFAWSCKGSLTDLVVLVVLDELLKRDDLAIEDIFNVKNEKLYENQSYLRDTDIIDISNIFQIEYGLNDYSLQSMNFRFTILKSDRPTSYKLKRISRDNISVVMNLCINENYNYIFNSNDSEILPKDTSKRIDRLTHGLVARIRSLKNNELRRNVGENNYIHDTIAVI